MNISEKCVDLVKSFEGFRPTAYLCPARVWTLGYGRTKGIAEGMTCTQAEADTWLREELEQTARGVLNVVHVPLTQGQLDACASLAYNIGLGAFGGSTLLKHLNARNYDGASRQFDSWVFAKGKKLKGLESRRAAEKRLFCEPATAQDSAV